MMVIEPKHVGVVLMSILSVNFKIVFKTVHLCISWWIKTLIIPRCTVCMWKLV